ncbi:Hypothetical protein SCLAV_3114 [Streptomyces clavuligerus]|uniref:Uncharacterized protein n=1 Tax=Streptomyces clavuligerus TaxID=1901 RepID=E2PXU5_STRCL|nr:Hypothetical protein SCLAV_3114 [Streptomyces clavuligerus]
MPARSPIRPCTRTGGRRPTVGVARPYPWWACRCPDTGPPPGTVVSVSVSVSVLRACARVRVRVCGSCPSARSPRRRAHRVGAAPCRCERCVRMSADRPARGASPPSAPAFV